MNLFQILILPVLAALAIRSAVILIKGQHPRIIGLIGVVIWVSASIAVLHPEWTIAIARVLGIGRGADLILYLLIIAYLISMYYIYTLFQKQEAKITHLVRYLAIQDALHRWPGQDLGETGKQNNDESTNENPVPNPGP